jgi:hypothetical protein
MWSMSEAWEHKYTRCHATHQQSPDRTLWCLGNRLHGTISKVQAVWIHLSGGWLCFKVGWSSTMSSYRFQSRQEDVCRNHLSTLCSSMHGD